MPVPDLGSLMVYGFPVVMVIGLIIAVVEWLAGGLLEEKVKAVITGALVVLGYLFIANQGPIETAVPFIKDLLPQLLTALVLFGAALGFTPGVKFFTTVNKIKSLGK